MEEGNATVWKKMNIGYGRERASQFSFYLTREIAGGSDQKY